MGWCSGGNTFVRVCRSGQTWRRPGRSPLLKAVPLGQEGTWKPTWRTSAWVARIELEWYHRDDQATPLGPLQLSDGTLRFICLATLLLQPPELQPNPIIIDEPELGLHPLTLTLLAEMVRSATEARKVIVSTQSADLVGEFEPEDVVVVNRRNGESLFERLDSGLLQDWLKEYSVGQLWKAEVVGGGPAS